MAHQPGRAPDRFLGRPGQQAYADPAAARQLLATIERRALTAIDEKIVDEVVDRLTTSAGIAAARWWPAQRFSPIAAFADTLTRREQLAATVDAIRQSGRTVAPLQLGPRLLRRRPALHGR